MRNISFALTTEQIRNQTKTVTRRLGWTFLKPGDLLQPIVKGQGIPKGAKVEKIGAPIQVVKVSYEQLSCLNTRTYGAAELAREGGRWKTGQEFIDMFCAANGCERNAVVTRIEFSYTRAAARVEDLETLLKAIVINWDAQQDQEFDEALTRAREFIGFKLAKRTDGPRG